MRAARGRLGAAIACGCLAVALGIAGCSDDDDDAASAPGAPPLATKSIGPYKFDDPQVAREADAARRATGRYLDESKALADGYEPQPSRNAPVCNDPPGKGDGGIEYVNQSLVGEEPDVRKPPVLYYEPDEFGGRRLTALQYRAPEGKTGGTLFNQPLNESLTVWLYRYNTDGLFAPGNVSSNCPPGPPKTPAEPPPRRGEAPRADRLPARGAAGLPSRRRMACIGPCGAFTLGSGDGGHGPDR